MTEACKRAYTFGFPMMECSSASMMRLASTMLSILASGIHAFAPAARTAHSTTVISLPTGLDMEVMSCMRANVDKQQQQTPPLLFVHGSYHAAWCWAECWMPYFSEQGYDSYAVSLRGTSKSKCRDAGATPRSSSVKVTEHVADLQAVMQTLFAASNPPVVIAHSFGGLLLMKVRSFALHAA